MVEAYVAGQVASMAGSSFGTTTFQNKESKRTIVVAGCIVIVLLAVVDAILLYLWLGAPRQARSRTASALGDRAENEGAHGDDSEYPLLFDFVDPRNIDGHIEARRLCATSGCSWLNAYMGQQSAEALDPCDDFYLHACGRRGRTVYEDGRSRLMEAMMKAMLHGSLLPTTPSDSASLGAGVARQNPYRGEMNEEHLNMLKLCLNESEATVSSLDLGSDCEVASAPECPSRMPLALTSASENFFRRKSNATINDYADFVESVATRLTTDKAKQTPSLTFRSRVLRSSLVSKEWFKRACHWVSLAARCHLRVTLGRSDADLRAYQRAWKVLYFAPFRGPQARPLLSILYAGAAAPRVHACLTIMADVFEGAAFSVAKHVLQEAVHDLEGSLSQLGRDASLAMDEFAHSMMADIGADFQQSARTREHLSQRKRNELHVALADSYNGPAGNVDLFASQVRFVDNDEQRLLVVSPGLLSLFVNVSSSAEPVLVPALEKPILRAILTARKPQGPSHALLTALVLSKLSHCFATWVNVSEPLSSEVAAEAVILEPLFQLYRKALVESIGENTLLHPNYTNAQLFFHLWAHCHCGKEDGRLLVNAVARNSLLFSRTFRCSASKGMAYEDTCSLDNQL